MMKVKILMAVFILSSIARADLPPEPIPKECQRPYSIRDSAAKELFEALKVPVTKTNMPEGHYKESKAFESEDGSFKLFCYRVKDESGKPVSYYRGAGLGCSVEVIQNPVSKKRDAEPVSAAPPSKGSSNQ